MIERPGWIRMSIHPTTTDAEVSFICKSIRELAENFNNWKNDYQYNAQINEFIHKRDNKEEKKLVLNWFKK